MGTRKTILLICPFATPNLGGVETHIDKLISQCVRNGYYVTLLTYQPLTRKIKSLSFEKGKGFEIHRCSWFGIGLFTKLEKFFPLVFLYLFPGLFVISLSYYLRNFKFISCIHAHGLVAASVSRVLTLIRKKRSVVSTHAVYNFDKRKLLSFIVFNIFKGFDSVLAVSEVSKSELIHMGLDEKLVKVHPNWIDTNIFKPLGGKKRMGELTINKKFNILFVGRLIEKKGIILVLEAARLLNNIGFHVVGTGPLSGIVKSISDECENIRFYGILQQDSPQDLEKLLCLYNCCDYLISPYLYDEGYSATLIESIACGTPVIVPNRGSPPTFLSNEVAVYLPFVPQTEDLVNVLRELCAYPKSEKVVEKCRNFALEKFGPSNSNIIIEAYER